MNPTNSIYKLSHYCLLIDIPETKEYLLFNTVTGGLHTFGYDLGKVLAKMSENDIFTENDKIIFHQHINELLRNNIVVDKQIDEKRELFKFYDQKRKNSVDKDNSSISLTIGTTINCNMGCPYCFQFVRPKNSLRGDTVDEIIFYLEDLIKKSPVKKWRSFQLTWFGGEPLVNKQAITSLSPKIIEFCNKHELQYSANIITNGILLSEDVFQMLSENQVNSIQVTIDGSQEIHDINRPLKALGQENYTKILKNLQHLPDDIHVNVRMNFDRKVMASLPQLFSDLEEYKLWPHKYKNFSFTPAWLRTYEGEEIKDEEKKNRLTNEEFFDAMQDFRKMQLNLFNKWGKANDIKKAKLKWVLPQLQDECPTWASPYGVVIDPEGFIHKCWETFHEEEGRLGHVSEGYQIEKLKYFTDYNRADLNEECYNCKYLPVCDQLSCAVQTENEIKKPPCTYWKEKAVDTIKEQYLEMTENPGSMVLPKTNVKEMSAHANK